MCIKKVFLSSGFRRHIFSVRTVFAGVEALETRRRMFCYSHKAKAGYMISLNGTITRLRRFGLGNMSRELLTMYCHT
jgi:hypothetical protein